MAFCRVNSGRHQQVHHDQHSNKLHWIVRPPGQLQSHFINQTLLWAVCCCFWRMPKKYYVPSTFCKFLRFARWNTFGVDYNSSPSRTANSHTVSFSPFYVSYCTHLWLISPFRVCITVFVYYTHDHHNPHQHLLEEEEKFFPFSPDLYWVAGVHSADWVHFQGIVFAPWILIIFIAPDPDFFCAVHTRKR